MPGLVAGCVELGNGCDAPARGRYPLNHVGGTVQNSAVRAPGSTLEAPDVAQHLRRAARDVDTFEHTARDETDGFAVGRPEGSAPALGAGEFTNLEGVHCSEPNRVSALADNGPVNH